MEVKVRLSNLRTAPRKTRLAADLVRGKTLQQAVNILSFTTNKSARDILKLINSAAATAKHDFHLDENNLFVSRIMVDEGPKLKRWHPMSRGRAYSIMKRTSHIVVILSEISPTTKTEAKGEAKPEKQEKTAVKPKAKKAAPKVKKATTKAKKS
ncbi:MAG TPA: 50S ribosomal protein L22 [Candidatus Staskawiczbacteria bacterium]|nr:50S ribosomal protein L22 [Candidatus Staskawiczbacteria bacterium]